jgi:hypothetical protein
MADTAYAAAPTPDLYGSRAPEAQAALLQEVRRCFRSAEQYEQRNRRQQEQWLKFRSGEQWDPADKALRQADGRPCLTINTLAQSEHQITNEMRQNMPALTVLPVGNGADVDTAKLLKGLVRHCNTRSHAEGVRELAYTSAVRIGVGYYRMVLEYDDWQSFDQEPRIAAIRNQFACYLDPAATSQVGRDARWGFVFEHHDKTAFQQEWGIDAGTLNAWGGVSDSWVFKDHVRVAEYFWQDAQRYTLARLRDGQTLLLEPYLLSDLPTLQAGGYSGQAFQAFVSHLLTPRPRYAPLLPWLRQQAGTTPRWLDGFPGDFVQAYAVKVLELVANITAVRPTTATTVRWIKTNGHVILEESIWPGQHLPLLRVVGEEMDLDNQVERSGIIKNAMDPMRLENYFLTMMVEHVALAPLPGYVLDPDQIAGYEGYWQQANRKPFPYLPVRQVSRGGQLLPPPTRQAYEPPVQALGVTLQLFQQYRQQAVGIYQGNVGAPSTERSGRAIAEKDRQADTGTYHYVAHLGDTMEYEGELYLEVIPATMSPGKIQRVLSDDGSPQQIRLAGSPQEKQQLLDDPQQMEGLAGVYDLSTGAYDVVVDLGPSYATKRQEAADQMLTLVGTLPEAMGPVISQVVEKMDWEGARELSDLLKQLPGQLLPQQGANKDQQLALVRQQLTQAAQHLQALDALAQQLQQANQALVQDNQRLKDAHDLEALKVQDMQRDSSLAEREAQQKAQVEWARLDLERQKLALERDRMEREAEAQQAAARNGSTDT